MEDVHDIFFLRKVYTPLYVAVVKRYRKRLEENISKYYFFFYFLH